MSSGKRTIVLHRLNKEERAKELAKKTPRHLPLTRGDCLHGPRPCPFVSCKHHLYLDVTKVGNITLRFPDLEPHELEHSCSLDVAECGGVGSPGLGKIFRVTREAMRLEVRRALLKLEGEEGDPITR